MTKQEELSLYKKALIDWEKPFKRDKELLCEGNCMNTELGFCFYFLHEHGITTYKGMFKNVLPVLYEQRINRNSVIHYNGYGDQIEGRQQRVQALKNAIEILEKELKGK